MFKCIVCDFAGEDNTLELVVEEGVRHRFLLSNDCSLKHLDSDDIEQETCLECPICGQQYGFKDDLELILEKKFSLSKIIFSSDYRCEIVPIVADDLQFVRKTNE